MKRILLLAAVLLMAVACGKKEKTEKILVLYYSQTGNTEAVAKQIQAQLGADIEAIVPALPYDGDFNATIERGKKELDGGILPELQPIKANIQDYDVIFLGFPVWFGTYAQPIATILADCDFTGKRVVPFCTFGSGGLDSSSRNIMDKLSEAEVLPGYGVRAARMDAVPAEVERFLKSGGFLPGTVEPLPDFPALRPVTEEESALFDAAVGSYPMIRAKAEEVASRPVPGGTEYLFAAQGMKIYVLALDGQEPVFTQVVR